MNLRVAIKLNTQLNFNLIELNPILDELLIIHQTAYFAQAGVFLKYKFFLFV